MFQLSTQQLSELSDLYDTALAGDQTTEGLWRPVYDALFDFMTDLVEEEVPEGPPIVKLVPKEGVDHDVWLWVSGARYINSNETTFAEQVERAFRED